jgi:hypothetical protein
MATLSDKAVRQIATAVADVGLGNEIATNINLVAGAPFVLASVIVATAVSPTTDFGSLKVGDRVLALAAGAGGAVNGYLVATAGTLPAAAVIGSNYWVFRSTAQQTIDTQLSFKF